jgi:hypothetical protein
MKLVIAFVLLYLLYYMVEREYVEQTYLEQTTTTLEQGYCRLSYPEQALELLPGYQFLDYVYRIDDGTLSTFHRDVTSSQTVYQTKHPVYTLIHYLYEGELLSVCPGSHRSLFVGRILNLNGKSGTCFLFNSDLLHAGRNNQCRERHVIQYKLCHPEDLPLLSHLQGIRAHKQERCYNTPYASMMRKLSYYCQLPLLLATPLMLQREQDTLVGALQSVIPLSYYNNT